MSIGSAEAIRTDGSTADRTVCIPGPRQFIPGNDGRNVFQFDVGTWFLKMKMSRNYLILERQDYFDESCHPCRSFTMANIGFHGTKNQRMIRSPSLTITGGNGLNLNRISKGCASAVGFHIGDCIGR